MHDGTRSRQLGLPGIPSRAEIAIVERDIALARRTGCAMHIQHVSCGATANLIRAARDRGVRVSGELTPHHLALCDAQIEDDPARFKMSPPIRTKEDRHALQAAIADGTLTAFATDHAPHPASEKALGFREAPFGVVGLETAVGVTYTLMVEGNRMSRIEWLRRWTTGPAGVLGLAPPSLEAGSTADVAILDLSSTWTVNPDDFVSLSNNTPFGGQTLTGRAVYTFCAGRPAHGCR
jgi:dihydroorotase